MNINDIDPKDITEVKAPLNIKDIDPSEISAPKLNLKDLNPSKITEVNKTSDSSLSDTVLATAGGVSQGGTAGLGDELYGLAEATGLNKLIQSGIKNYDEVINGERPSEPIQETSQPDKSFMDMYREGRDFSRGINKDLSKQSPIAYNVGDIGAGIGLTAGIPFAAAKDAGLLAKVATPVASGALQGGVEAFGRSEASNPTDLLKETGIGVGVGGTIGGVSAGIGSLLEGSANKAALSKVGMEGASPEVASKIQTFIPAETELERAGVAIENLANKSRGAPEDVIKEMNKTKNYLENRLVSGSQSKILSTAKELRDKSYKIITDVSSDLDRRSVKTFDPKELVYFLDSTIKPDIMEGQLLKGSTEAYNAAVSDILSHGTGPIDFLKASNIETILSKYSGPEQKVVDDVLEVYKNYYYKSVLKGVQESADKYPTNEVIIGLTNATKNYDLANNLIESLSNKVKKQPSAISDYLVNMAKRKAVGATIGAGLGGTTGDNTENSILRAGVGAVGGAAVSTFRPGATMLANRIANRIGQPMVKGAINATVSAVTPMAVSAARPSDNSINSRIFTSPKYGAQLSKIALERGPAAAAAMSYTLQQRDPEFRKHVLEDEK